MELSYYPGCSLESSAREYDDSIRRICDALDITLREIPDWNCCGASSAHSINPRLAVDLAARNLVIASRIGLPVLSPCAACFARLKIAHKEVIAHPDSHGDIPVDPNLSIIHLNELLTQPAVLQKIKQKRKRSLDALKIAPYYGCLTMRPPLLLDAENHEAPVSMDAVLDALGVQVIDWSYKTDCCGGMHGLTRPDLVRKLSGRLYEEAEDAGADALVTDCPMCQANLDTRQREIEQELSRRFAMPVFYISELVALALGLPDVSRWWRRHLVSPDATLARLAPSDHR